MNTPAPKFFVLDQEGNLHGYDREDLLKCDLVAPALNPANPAVKIFRLNETGLTTNYYPITIADLGIHRPLPIRSIDSEITERTALRPAA
jgi:hypothetical protein